MNQEKHECKLRNKIIDDGDCFETVMAVNGLNAISFSEKLLKKYPNAKAIQFIENFLFLKEICNDCKFNLDKLNNESSYIKVYQSESASFIEKKIIGKYKYIGGENTTDLVKNSIYYRIEPENEFRIVDESGEDYLYVPDNFEKVE